MKRLHIDIETYSDVDLKTAGLYKYVRSPSFEILLLAAAYDGEPVGLYDFTRGDHKRPSFKPVQDAIEGGAVIKRAYNAAFEIACLSRYFRIDPEEWECGMIHGLYCGYPAGLSAVGDALGLPRDKKKSAAGASLIRLFCVPCEATARNGNRTRTLPGHEPEKWELFKAYCAQDVVTEMAVDAKLAAFPVPRAEWALWRLDLKQNAMGVAIDAGLVDNAIAIDEAAQSEVYAEAAELSGLKNPRSVAQLKNYLSETLDEEIENLNKDTVLNLLEGDLGNDVARRMLEIRQELSKTSTKKYASMKNVVCDDGRARGLLQFYGANRTGRWAGRLIQVQNLPRNKLETLNLARETVKAGRGGLLKYLYGDVPGTLSQLIRTAFIAEPGNLLYVADYSAIEARVIAWLAGEQWRLDVFASHGKIYEASAAAMFGVDIGKIQKGNPEYALRQKGKIAELALGYQGGAGALKAMGALDMGLTEAELPDIVKRWRQANRRIEDLWYAAGNAAYAAIKTGVAGLCKGVFFTLESDCDLTFLTIALPSGRKLYYASPRIEKDEGGRESLSYVGVDQITKKWGRIPTYGGKLVENITQAVARDCLAEAIKRVGAGIVMHIHDEIVAEFPADDPDARLKQICALMSEPIQWAPGLLLRAEGFYSPYYKKE
jgi:DNA polymerase